MIVESAVLTVATRDPVWQRETRAARDSFAARLHTEGWSPLDEKYARIKGIPHPATGTIHDVTIDFGGDWPYGPPVITIERTGPLTWHQEADGSACMWRTSDNAPIRWSTPEEVLDRIDEFLLKAHEDFSGDPPDMDLERYFNGNVHPVLVTYEDVNDLRDGPLVTDLRNSSDDNRLIWCAVESYAPQGGRDEQFIKQLRRRRSRNLYAVCVDLGRLDRPVHNWETLTEAISNDRERRELKSGLRRAGKALVLVKYERKVPNAAPQRAATALWITLDGDKPKVGRAIIAEDSQRVRHWRRGLDASRFADSSVAIVGLGSVGSAAAARLASLQPAQLTLVDGDLLTPGNTVRHLCSEAQVAMKKVDAVRKVLVDNLGMLPASIKAKPERLRPELAFQLLSEHDVVIDATANNGVSWMLEEITGKGLGVAVTVAVHRDGELIRVDRFGGASSPATRLEPIPELDTPDTSPVFREGGCGDPVSPTPPWVTELAASEAAVIAVDAITERWQHPDSLIRVLVCQPDAPYDQVRTIMS